MNCGHIRLLFQTQQYTDANVHRTDALGNGEFTVAAAVLLQITPANFCNLCIVLNNFTKSGL